MRALRTAAGIAAIAVLAALVPGVSSGATGDIGFEGPPYTGAAKAPSGSKPESKLWWNDGSWWGSLFDSASGDFHIFGLDVSSEVWVDTGVPLDDRPNSRADTLWDGTHLYVASHIYSTSPTSGYPARLYRYSYDASTRGYIRDAGFPVAINAYRTETLVLEKDSRGALWATWTQGNQVWVSHTDGDDATWSTPFVPPLAGTTVASDDISSLVSFGGNAIGLMWSNQSASAMYFAVHHDGDAATVWESSRTAIQGPKTADDHINLKSLQSDGSGRVFAAVKTSTSTSAAPLILLLVRDPATGNWSSSVFGRVADHHTRAIVLLDEENAVIHMFATSPEAGGTIYEKTSALDPVSFPGGLGTPVMRDADAPDINNATSTKQNVTSATGLVVLASNDATGRYWHLYETPGPLPPPPPPPPSGAVVTATPAADAYVSSGAPDKNFGMAPTLRVRTASTTMRSYLRFEVAGTGSIVSARLRLHVSDPSPNGGSLYSLTDGWSESDLTWRTAPLVTGTPLAVGPVPTAGVWVEADVGSVVTDDGTYSFVISDGSSNTAIYDSRESANPPQLVVTSLAPPSSP